MNENDDPSFKSYAEFFIEMLINIQPPYDRISPRSARSAYFYLSDHPKWGPILMAKIMDLENA